MPISPLISHFTLTITLYLLLQTTTTTTVNITDLLSPYPNLSLFSSFLSTTTISGDLSVTLLAVPNSFLHSSPLPTSPTTLSDVIRYHILLQHLSFNDLTNFPPSGKLIPTLFQPSNKFSYVNVTHNRLTNSTTIQSFNNNNNNNNNIFNSSNSANVIESLLNKVNVSILTVDSLLIPYETDLPKLDTRHPLINNNNNNNNVNINITKAITDGHNYNVAASMLAASGVVQEFESDENGAGITIFVPTDNAFSDLPVTADLQSLPADKKADVLKFHVLHSYYTLGSLQSIVNPVQPTLATEDKGAGMFTLNISRVNGSVGINTGIVEASVTQTVLDQNPVAIFGVSRVLLPKEIFGKNGIDENAPVGYGAPSPVNYPPELFVPSLSPAYGEGLHSSATVQSVDFVIVCIGLLYVFV